HFDPGIYKIDTDIYDRTHNQFLEMLATTGLVGAIAFLAIWFAIGMTLVRAFRAGRLSASAVAVLAGLQVAYATYLFFWFVDLSSTMLWILVSVLSRPRSLGVDAARRRILARALRESFAAFARELHRATLSERLCHHEGGLLVEAAEYCQSPSYHLQAIDAFHKAFVLGPPRT